MLARGALGNPWLFAEVLGVRDPDAPPSAQAVVEELDWIMERTVEHLGAVRAGATCASSTPGTSSAWARARPCSRRSSARTRWTRRARCSPASGRSPCPPDQPSRRRPQRRYTPPPLAPSDRQDRMPKDVILTPEGLENLKVELEELSTTRRAEVAERIKEAREFGDISENSEYDDAKNEQAMLETRIAQLEEKIRSASVVDPDEVDTEVVQVGNAVKVQFDDGKEQTFTIVGSAEAKPPAKLSNESPIGKALLGHRTGDAIEVSLPNGSKRRLTVTQISVGL
jgi:transcription elongation factor GreA